MLKKYDAPATFFVEGAIASANEKLIKKIYDAGHEIENHSWGHEHFKALFEKKGATGIKSSVSKTDNAIFKATGRHSRFFRPPYWQITDKIEEIIAPLGYKIMKLDNPDINTEDYADAEKHRLPEVLAKRVKKIIAGRERQKIFDHVLVFHELSVTTEAMETLIPYFQSQGYKFIRLDEYKGERPC